MFKIPNKSIILGLFLILVLVLMLFYYIHFKKHECDNPCITMFNNKNVPVLIEWKGYTLLIGAGDVNSTLINQIGKVLPFFTSSLNTLITVDNSTSSNIATIDFLKKYNVEKLFDLNKSFMNSTSSIFSTSTGGINLIISKELYVSKSKKVEPKFVYRIELVNSEDDSNKKENLIFKFDVNTTVAQKKVGFGKADFVFLKNVPVGKKQEHHITDFFKNTRAEYFVSMSGESKMQSKNNTIFEIANFRTSSTPESSNLGNSKILFPLLIHLNMEKQNENKNVNDGSIFCRLNYNEKTNHRMECGGKRESFFGYLLIKFGIK